MSTKKERKETLEKMIDMFDLKIKMSGTGHSDYLSIDYLTYKDRHVITINEYEANRAGFACYSRYDYVENDTANKDFIYQLSRIPAICKNIDKIIEEEKQEAIRAIEEEEKRRERILKKIENFKIKLSKNKGTIDAACLKNNAVIIIDNDICLRRKDGDYANKTKLTDKEWGVNFSDFTNCGYALNLTYESTIDAFNNIF